MTATRSACVWGGGEGGGLGEGSVFAGRSQLSAIIACKRMPFLHQCAFLHQVGGTGKCISSVITFTASSAGLVSVALVCLHSIRYVRDPSAADASVHARWLSGPSLPVDMGSWMDSTPCTHGHVHVDELLSVPFHVFPGTLSAELAR